MDMILIMNISWSIIQKIKNHKALIYFAINDHMYLVNETHTKSLVEKAKADDHSINTSLLESIKKINLFDDLKVFENIDFNDIDKYDNVSCVFMYSRNIHNINDIFYLFLSKYNNIPCADYIVDKRIKANIFEKVW